MPGTDVLGQPVLAAPDGGRDGAAQFGGRLGGARSGPVPAREGDQDQRVVAAAEAGGEQEVAAGLAAVAGGIPRREAARRV